MSLRRAAWRRPLLPLLLVLSLLTALAFLPASVLAQTYQVSQKLREDMPAFRFTLDYAPLAYTSEELAERAFTQEADYLYIHTITVVREDDGSTVQQIQLDPPSETYDEETLGLVLEDMNFDGFADLRVMQGVSAGVNIPYHCWLWNSASWTFAYSEELSAIPSPWFDPAAKRVMGFELVDDSEYADTTYAYDGSGHLQLIGRVTTGYDYESRVVITTTEQWVDGAFQITSRTKESMLEP